MKIKYILYLFITILIQCETVFSQNHTVILVSMDGFRWDYASLYHTPNLDKIAKSGVKAHSLIPSFPSVTFPNHYTIVTGLYPDHHGLINNNFYDDSLQLSYSIGNRMVVQNPAFYKGEPIWNTAGRQGLKTASFYWVGSEAPINGRQPDFWKKYDARVDNLSRIDTVMKWLKLPLKERPRLITLYFSEPDHAGHTYGPVHPETKKVVENMDSVIGMLVNKLKKNHLDNKTDLIIVSDHGMSAVSEERNIILDQYIKKEWCARIEGHNPVYLIEPGTEYQDSILYNLKQVPHLKVWKKEEIPSKLHYGSNPRIFKLAVLADSSYSLTWSFKKLEKGGAHGYDPQNTDMQGIFYAIGPDIKKHLEIPSFENIEIYNLLANLLGIVPAKNDGNPERLIPILSKDPKNYRNK